MFGGYLYDHAADGDFAGHTGFAGMSATERRSVGPTHCRSCLSTYNVMRENHFRAGISGANWIRPDSLKRKWRAVVGQLATLKADQISSIAEDSYALAA
jgi:hypothetical protein